MSNKTVENLIDELVHFENSRIIDCIRDGRSLKRKMVAHDLNTFATNGSQKSRNSFLWAMPSLSKAEIPLSVRITAECENVNVVIAGKLVGRVTIACTGSNSSIIWLSDHRAVSSILVKDKAQALIGEGVSIGGMEVSLDNADFSIGALSTLSNEIVIQGADFHGIYTLDGDLLNGKRSDIRLGRHTWIGRRVSMTKNAVIGQGSVIALGSVVTGNIPAQTIAAGNPARVVRENIRWGMRMDGATAAESTYLDDLAPPTLLPTSGIQKR